MIELSVTSFCDGGSTGQYVLRNLFPYVNLNYFAYELNPKATSITKTHFPSTNNLGDIRNWRSGVLQMNSSPDLFLAGTCCKNTSNAGNRTGFATLSGVPVTNLQQYITLDRIGIQMNESAICFWESIWFIKEMKPKYMFFEIPPLHNDFLQIFIKETGLDHILIDSKLVSAQSRKRWYFTNIPNLSQPQDLNITIDSIIPGAKAYSIHGAPNHKFGQPGEFKYGTRRIHVRTDDKMNTIVTQPHNTNKVIFSDGTIRTITPEEAEQFMGYPIGHTDIKGISKTDRYRILGNGWSIPVIKHIFYGLSGVIQQPNLICNDRT